MSPFPPTSTYLTLKIALLLAIGQGVWAWDGSGTSADPYLIKSSADWKQLANEVSGGNSYSAQYFEMAADIDAQGVSVGASDKPFSGTFSGGMYTLTYNAGTTSSYSAGSNAPFLLLKGGASRDQSRACMSFGEAQPALDKVKGGASRDQSRACMSFGEAQPALDEVKGGDTTTRALSLDNHTLNATWKTGETVDVYKITGEIGSETYTYVGKLTAQANGTQAILSGNLTGTFVSNDDLALFFNGGVLDYTGQTGTLDGIASKYDYATANVKVDVAANGTITIQDGGDFNDVVPFDNQQAIVKFTLKDKVTGEPISMKSLTLHDGGDNIFETTYYTSVSSPVKGDITVTRATAGSEFFVAVKTEEDYVESDFIPCSLTLTLTATDGTDTYTYSKSDVKFYPGKYYEITVKMQKK